MPALLPASRPLIPTLVAASVLLLSAPVARAQEAASEAAVVATVQALFDAMEAADSRGVMAVLDPSARLEGLTPGSEGGARRTPLSAEAFAASVESAAPGSLVERMWEPEVRVDGPVAQLWAPYDFYRGGELSHCGVDAVHLVRTDGAWKIVAITWTTSRPPACELHPEGPPGAS